jgi:hypothetical protein
VEILSDDAAALTRARALNAIALSLRTNWGEEFAALIDTIALEDWAAENRLVALTLLERIHPDDEQAIFDVLCGSQRLQYRRRN